MTVNAKLLPRVRNHGTPRNDIFSSLGLPSPTSILGGLGIGGGGASPMGDMTAMMSQMMSMQMQMQMFSQMMNTMQNMNFGGGGGGNQQLIAAILQKQGFTTQAADLVQFGQNVADAGITTVAQLKAALQTGLNRQADDATANGQNAVLGALLSGGNNNNNAALAIALL